MYMNHTPTTLIDHMPCALGVACNCVVLLEDLLQLNQFTRFLCCCMWSQDCVSFSIDELAKLKMLMQALSLSLLQP